MTTVAPDDAEGRLKEAYDWQAERLGAPTEFTTISMFRSTCAISSSAR